MGFHRFREGKYRVSLFDLNCQHSDPFSIYTYIVDEGVARHERPCAGVSGECVNHNITAPLYTNGVGHKYSIYIYLIKIVNLV